jgi:hypothetical protein
LSLDPCQFNSIPEAGVVVGPCMLAIADL